MPAKPGGNFINIRRQKARASRRKAHRDYNRTRTDKGVVVLYNTQRWKKLRRLKFQLNPLCEMCSDQGLVVVADVVHHRVEAKEDPSLFFCMENLQSLCNSCHAKIHNA